MKKISNDKVKESILNLLESSQFPVTTRELAIDLGLREVNDTFPKIRQAIRVLINEGWPIGASSEGYFLLTTAKDVQEYLNNLLQRQMGISKRIQAVYDAAIGRGII